MRVTALLLLLALAMMALLVSGQDSFELTDSESISAEELPALLQLAGESDADIEAEAEQAAQAELQAQTEGDADAETETEAESEVDTEAEADVDTEAEAEAETETEAEGEAEVDTDAETESEVDVDAEAEAEAEAALDSDLLELQASEDPEGGEEKPENPTYVLPYPPVLPGHYTPLFNPYTNVNPLSTPFANYAAQPGAHPGVASAAAAQAGSLAAINGQIAGHAGGWPFFGAGIAGHAGAYPYYPYAARNPIIAGQLNGNPIPFSGYAGWIHPQNLNSAAVGENEQQEFPQFMEVESSESETSDDNGCVGCSFN